MVGMLLENTFERGILYYSLRRYQRNLKNFERMIPCNRSGGREI